MALTKLTYGYSIRPRLGCRVSGDTVIVRKTDFGLFTALIDIAGHGERAHKIAKPLQSIIQERKSCSPRENMSFLNHYLQGVSAAVAAMAFITNSGEVTYCGMDNIRAAIFGKKHHTLSGSAGLLGKNFSTSREYNLQMHPTDTLAICSDGISSGFSLPQKTTPDPWVTANEVVFEFGRDYDDSTCLIVRLNDA